MVRVRLPTPHAACNAIERQTAKIRPIVGSGSYARCVTSDKFVSAVISHESPANGPKGEWDVGARTPLVRSGSGTEMKRDLRVLAAAGALLTVLATVDAAFAQKQGGILRMYSPDSPASMSIHEEATIFAEGPMMGVFNNLVITTSMCRKTVCSRLCPIWPPAGPGTRTEPS